MAGVPELEISLAAHSAISIPSSLGSQSTAVSNQSNISYSQLPTDGEEGDVAPFEDADALAAKPNFNVSEANDALNSQDSLLDDDSSHHIKSWRRPGTWLRTNQDPNASPEDNPWKPSFRRTGPILGLTALAFILLSIPASALVLALSNGKPVEQWRVQPSVYISVLTGIGNKALGFASIQGAIITWWVKAFKGTTLGDLHYDWPIGNGVFAFLSRKHLSMLTVTSICAFAIVFDAVLLQSATYTTESNLEEPVTLRAMLSPEIPTNYTATGVLWNTDNAYLNAEYSPGIEPIRRQWTKGESIPSPLQGCEGTCTAKILAAALDRVGCYDFDSTWVNFTQIYRQEKPLPYRCDPKAGNTRCVLFELNVWPSTDVGASELINITFGRFSPIDPLNKEDCAGNFTYTACAFRSAIAEYDVTTHTDKWVDVNTASPRIVAIASNTARKYLHKDERINTTIGGIALLGSMDFYSNVGMWGPGSENQYTDNINRIQSRFISNADEYFNKTACAPVWKDPVPEVVTVLNRLMFSTSVQVAKDLDEEELLSRIDRGLQISYDVKGLRIDAQPIFRTRWVFFWGATVIQVVCVGLVLMTYWDYWKLGRAVSLSPLEIAKAFDAELLKGADGNAGADGLAKSVGEKKIQYGIVKGQKEDERGRLMFVDTDVDEVKCPNSMNAK